MDHSMQEMPLPGDANDRAVNAMKKLFDDLPEKQGKTLWLLFGLGMTRAEAARDMGIPEEMVLMFEQLGLRSLKSLVGRDGNMPASESETGAVPATTAESEAGEAPETPTADDETGEVPETAGAEDETAALDGMKRMFDTLPEQQGKALWLLYGRGLSPEDAAREMGVAAEILEAFAELGLKTLASRK